MKEACRLRYQVYCEEGRVPGFDPASYPDGIEKDDCDARSVHSLLRHRPTGLWAGTVRLVLCDPVDPGTPFPGECYMGDLPDRSRRDLAAIPRRQLAEVSRLLLASRFRSRKGEHLTAHGLTTAALSRHTDRRAVSLSAGRTERHAETNRRLLLHPILGLVLAVIRMSADHGLTHWYFVTEHQVVRLLRRVGMEFQEITGDIEYHGIRRAYFTGISEFLERVYHVRPEVWALITGQGTLWPAPLKDGGRKVLG